jgi:competence protein ComEA
MRHHLRPALVRCLLLAALAVLPAARGADLNGIGQAELERLKGVGPSLSDRIVAQRALQPFEGWTDLIRRVPGIGPHGAKRLAAQGLTVAGEAYAPMSAASGSSAASAR